MEQDFKLLRLMASTLIWNCEIDDRTDFTGVALDEVRIDPESKQLLQYNARRMRWECFYKYKDWYKDDSKDERNKFEKIMLWFVKFFWWCSDYGNSTKRIIGVFFTLSAVFALLYGIFPNMIYSLACDDSGTIDGGLALRIIRPIYFSIVTMTTLGFGDMHAEKHSFFGHLFLTIQVLLGYTILGALVTRFAVMFQAGGPTLRFKDVKKKVEKNN